VQALPKHYWDALVNYYTFVHSPRESEDSDDFDGAVINVDKMTTARRMTFKENWGQDTQKGEAV
jgi:hypothetical protein